MINMAKTTKGGKATGGKKVPPAEAFIQFQIDAKLKEIEQLKVEIEEMEVKNQNLITLQQQLRQEQQAEIGVLHKEEKGQEQNVKENELSNKEKVEQAVQKNVELAHIQEEQLKEQQRLLTNAGDTNIELQKQHEAWELYKKSERVEIQQQLQRLQSEFDSMQKNFEAMLGYVDTSLKENLIKVEQNAQELAEERKTQASEQSEQDVKQPEHNILDSKKNDWLKKEVNNYREMVSELEAAVSKLEEENQEHIEQLREHHLNYSLTSRNRFLRQKKHPEPRPSLLKRTAATGKMEQQSEELEESEKELLHLDPSEPSTLSIVGQAMPVHPFEFDPYDVDMLARLGLLQPEDGPFTTAMIRDMFQ